MLASVNRPVNAIPGDGLVPQGARLNKGLFSGRDDMFPGNRRDKANIHEFEFNFGGGVIDIFITSNALGAAYVQKYLVADIGLHTEFVASESIDNGRPVYHFLNKESGDHFYMP